jgi:sortase A
MARVSRRRKRISTILLIAGLGCIGFWLWSVVRGELYQREANRKFEEATRSMPRPPVPPPAIPPEPRPGTVIGRLEIPRLHLSAIVREGTDSHTLGIALGHVRGTAMPGAAGNVAVAGHRDTLFRCLRNITKDDQIVFQTTYGDYTYRVESTKIVKPSDVAVLAAGKDPEITLVTCYPFYYVGAAPDRFIVHALLLPQAAEKRPAAAGSQSLAQPTAPHASLALVQHTPSHASWRISAGQKRGHATSRRLAERRPVRSAHVYNDAW